MRVIILISLIFIGVFAFLNPSIPQERMEGWDFFSGGFEENLGQVGDFNGERVNDVLLKARDNNLGIFIRKDGVSYVIYHLERVAENVKMADTDDETKLHYARIDLELIGATIDKQKIIYEEELPGYANYYLPNCPDGILFVKTYQKVRIKDIYPGIDWVWKYEDGVIHHEFEVSSQANPEDIKIKVKYADWEIVDNKQLLLKTPLGNIKDGEIIAYEGNKKTDVFYRSEDGLLSFEVKKWQRKEKLIIDPPLSLIWATYYGGSGHDYGRAIATDHNGNVFIVGYTNSGNFPLQNPGGGAYYQGTIGGANDLFILKFNNNGQRLWATYYGGSGGEEGYSIAVDNLGNIFITGITTSDNFPTYNPGGGAYYQGSRPSPHRDAFILKFNNNGQRLWATYYGGSHHDDGYSIAIDDSNNVFVTGATRADNFPLQNPGGGAYYQGSRAGGLDLFILKFNNSGVRQWATYYGGTGDDCGYSISADNLGNIFLTGYTASANFPIQNPGGGAYYQSSNAGYNDAFILKFANNGARIWATYYGDIANEEGRSITFDTLGNIFITGHTTSTNFPLQQSSNPGAYFQGTLRGARDAFILKFNNSGVRQWATLYGGDDHDYGYAIDADYSGNIYITGYTQSTDFPTYNAGLSAYYDSTFNGGQDIFLLKFTDNCIRQWATFYGGGNEDIGWSVAVDDSGNFFVTGQTMSTDFPTLNPGGSAYYQDTLNSQATRDAFILKFAKAITYDYDVCVLEIISPEDTVPKQTITPIMAVKNCGRNSCEDFFAYLQIYNSEGNLVYNESTEVSGLIPEQGITLIYSDWTPDTVGQFTIIGIVYLTGDINPRNDTLIKNIFVYWKDVGISQIIQPVGNYLPGTQVEPKCKVKNFGNLPESYIAVRCSIPDLEGYYDVETVDNLAPYEEREVTFDQITIPIGTYQVYFMVTTEGDMDLSNDSASATFSGSFRDVGVKEILEPVGNIPKLPLQPKMVVKNYGTSSATFPAYFRIYDSLGNMVYNSEREIENLPVGEEITVEFDTWIPQTVGNFVVKGITNYDLDENRSNDTSEVFIFVYWKDVGISEIIQPVGGYSVGMEIEPKCKLKNYGNLDEYNVLVKCSIPTLEYMREIPVEHLEPYEEITITFDTIIISLGIHEIYFRTTTDGDMNSENDCVDGIFWGGQLDVGATEILSPTGIIQVGTTKPVSGKVKNFGELSVSFWTFFRIYDKDNNLVYIDSIYQTVEPSQEVLLNFRSYNCNDTGEFKTIIKTALTDMNPNNDSIIGNFKVATSIPQVGGWYRKQDVSGAQKPVKSGGALGALGDKVYALIGNNTRDLMAYYVNGDSWKKKSEVPLSSLTPKKKNVKKGAAITTDGKYLYIVKGNNTKEFWRYYPEGDSWKEYEVPFSKGIKGSSMTFDGDSFVYVICGSNNAEWKRFNIYTEQFEECNPPSLPANKWKTGSWIVYVNDTIYGLRVGGKINEFYMIPIGGQGVKKKEMPLFGSTKKKKKAKEGSAGAYNPNDNLIYALKGGNTLEFFAYDLRKDTWMIREDVGQPTGTPSKKVKGGGALTYSEEAKGLFAFIGNGINEFWLYIPADKFLANTVPSDNKGIQIGTTSLKNFALTVIPTKNYLKVSYTLPVNIKATLKIYNTLGELVCSAASDKGYFVINVKSFSSGIYILKFAANEYQATKKLIIH
ncbi:MAG: SBBP repeat-containing protein [candidate division WOR-3 bacterium]